MKRRHLRRGVLPSFGMRKGSLTRAQQPWVSLAHVTAEEAKRLTRVNAKAREDELNPLTIAARELGFDGRRTPHQAAVSETAAVTERLKALYLREADASEKNMEALAQVRAVVDELRAENEAIGLALARKGVELTTTPPDSPETKDRKRREALIAQI